MEDIQYKRNMMGVFESPIKCDIGELSIKELFSQKMDNTRLSKTKIADLLRMDVATLNKIVDGNYSGASVFNVLKVAMFLGISMDEFLRANADIISKEEVKDICDIRDVSLLCEYFDIKTLRDLGFFSDNNYAERIKQFFGFDRLQEYVNNIAKLSTAYSTAKNSYDVKMRNFWTTSAYMQFEKIANPHVYNRKRLLELLPNIRPYTKNVEKGLISIIRALYAIGVTIIYQPSIPKMQVRGATMEYNGKPCVVISDLNKRYPTLWFSLFHELYHVLFDFDNIKFNKYHISSSDGDLLLTDEDAADCFARAFILSPTKVRFIKTYINAPTIVERYAKEWGIHSSLIYAIAAFDDGKWAAYNKFIPKSDKATGVINTNVFQCDSIEQSSKMYKQKIEL
jgi:Zn-dependent peptidase ImmA (M78 family)|nr:MAG TPA_asm: IrrE protein [Caudoviricetes sp.]